MSEIMLGVALFSCAFAGGFFGTLTVLLVVPDRPPPTKEPDRMIEHDEKCLKALRGLVEMAHANWPRSQDITVSIASGVTAHGTVTIPVYLLDKLLTAHKGT